MVDFDIVGEIENIEIIAKGSAIRDLDRLREMYGFGNWRKMKGIAGEIRVKMRENSSLSEIIRLLRKEIPQLADRYRLRSLGVFGSYVRKTQDVKSDLDLLVTFHEPPSLLIFIELENHLTDLLGVKVDLVMQDALKPRIGKRVMREVVPV